MPIKQITPEEAHRLMQAGCPYIDVRTEGEFAAGHPESAVNIPVVYPDPAAGGMRLNDDFVQVVAAHFPKDRALIVGCQMGGRSQRAAEMLVQAGYAEVSNLQGGFGGARDAMGRVVAAGWAQSGLPVSTACHDNNSYAALKARAGR
jgi:rhodanese-related sulfurtransferase